MLSSNLAFCDCEYIFRDLAATAVDVAWLVHRSVILVKAQPSYHMQANVNCLPKTANL